MSVVYGPLGTQIGHEREERPNVDARRHPSANQESTTSAHYMVPSPAGLRRKVKSKTLTLRPRRSCQNSMMHMTTTTVTSTTPATRLIIFLGQSTWKTQTWARWRTQQNTKLQLRVTTAKSRRSAGETTVADCSFLSRDGRCSARCPGNIRQTSSLQKVERHRNSIAQDCIRDRQRRFQKGGSIAQVGPM